MGSGELMSYTTGLFCFDGPIFKDRNGEYCSITVNEEMLSRYLDVCDTLYLLVRTFESNKTYEELNMPIISNDRICVVEMPDYYSLKYLFFKKKEHKKIASIVEKSDLIFARMPSQTSNVILDVVQRMGKPYMVEVGGCAWDSFFNHSLKGKIIAPYMFYLERKNVRNADFASYVTKEFLQKRYPNYTLNQISCSNVYIEPNISNLSDKDKVESKFVILGTATNSIDVRYKGQDTVIKAIGLLKKKYNIRVLYDIVGPGSGNYLRSVAEKYDVANQVRFLGTKNKIEMQDWYKKIDIYIQPSKQEGLPRSVIEAISFGKYSLGTNVAGIPELLDENFLFNPGDYLAIARYIKHYLTLSASEKNLISNSNFEKSQEYSAQKLHYRRKEFFNKFKQCVLEGQDET